MQSFDFANRWYDYRLKWTPLSPITIIYWDNFFNDTSMVFQKDLNRLKCTIYQLKSLNKWFKRAHFKIFTFADCLIVWLRELKSFMAWNVKFCWHRFILSFSDFHKIGGFHVMIKCLSSEHRYCWTIKLSYCWLINLCDVELHVAVPKYSLDNQESGWSKLIYDYLSEVFSLLLFRFHRRFLRNNG